MTSSLNPPELDVKKSFDWTHALLPLHSHLFFKAKYNIKKQALPRVSAWLFILNFLHAMYL
ncbi:hypothetical protein VL06_04285 [Rossellomorea marisflavi]|nr:hypothetical protein VL03_13115 [Rossellomorea marisflavi]KML07148.1 hypothetical protein VL06_04285 [Rossellomorea marisflavi]